MFFFDSVVAARNVIGDHVVVVEEKLLPEFSTLKFELGRDFVTHRPGDFDPMQAVGRLSPSSVSAAVSFFHDSEPSVC